MPLFRLAVTCSWPWLLLLVLLASQVAQVLVLRSEADSLLLLRSTLGEDAAGELGTWGKPAPLGFEYQEMRKTDPCYPRYPWPGVRCSRNTDGTLTVTELDLRDFRVGGRISTALAGLKNLESLVLSRNSISGKIPDNLFELQHLKVLDLGDNQFTGSIPRLPPYLRSLQLNNNFLSGDLNLTSVFNLTRCEYMNLSNNRFTGSLPASREVMPSLEYLDLSHNQLEGLLAFDFLHRLDYFYLSDNNFEGGIPDGNWTSSDKYEIDLSANKLNGSIPSQLLQNSFMVYLNLSGNALGGTVDLRAIMPGTRLVDLSFNELENSHDLELRTETAEGLRVLFLQGNRFTGTLDRIFQNEYPELQELRVGGNSFQSGDLGLALRNAGLNFPLLQVMDLHSSGLAGSIPSRLFHSDTLPSLRVLDLSKNNLSGTIPVSLTQMSELQELHLQRNRLEGTKYADANWTNIQVLDLRHNLFEFDEDEIQALVENFHDLRELRIGGSSSKSLVLLRIVRMLSDLETLDLSSCNLIGEISANFTSFFPFLKSLNLSNNSLGGSLPEGFGQMPELIELDISHNRLSGNLPVFRYRAVNVSYIGNEGLCSSYLGDCPRAQGPFEVWKIVLVTVAGVVVSGGSSLFIGWIWRRKIENKKHKQDAELIATLLERDNTALMSLRELRRATDDFSEQNQIGVGGFGVVYRGLLEDGTMVAIKKSKRDGSTSEERCQFLNEVKILSQVHHRNLVDLLGCCLANKHALLVFEFVPNGTLLEHLQLKKDGQTPLTWSQRLRIAIQTAGALDYLHTSASPPIYHLDVKSSNILLDNDLNAKVADFGISRLAPTPNATHISTLHALQGTFGYMDPELVVKSKLTGKSDVYAFGVVLLELITAKDVLDRSRGEDVSLVNWVGRLIQMGMLEQVIDPLLLDTFHTPEGKNSIDAVAELAQRCLLFRSKDRPTMEDASRSLLNVYRMDWHSNASLFSTVSEASSTSDDIEIELSSSSSFQESTI